MMAGGGVVDSVTIEETVLKAFPYSAEAGTGNVPGAVGMARAVHFLNRHTIPVLQSHCKSLVSECINRLSDICTVYISDRDATSIFPFTVNGVHSSDVATILGAQNICVRSGKLCAEPYIDSISDSGSIVRASFGIYNTVKDVEVFADAVRTIHRKHS
jgi:cysteine desulfurase/selenocysteine lyase